VASLEIESRKRGENAGNRLRIAGEGAAPDIGKAGCPEGTQITVEHLFFNTPARLKFMKSAAYENGLIHDLMIQLALGYPEIDFRLENKGKALMDTRGVSRAEDLVELFYGREARQALVPVSAPVSRGRLSGWVTAPPFARGTRKGYHVFLNGRRISVKDMQWPIEKAFDYLLPRGRFPLLLLHFRLPGELLDVNVHPGKLEVRINDPELNPSITRVLRAALSGGGLLPDAGSLGISPGESKEPVGTAQKLWDTATERAGSGGSAHARPSDGRSRTEGLHREQDWASLFQIAKRGEGELDRLIRAGGVEEESKHPYELPPDSVLVEPLEKTKNLLREQWGVESHNKSLRALAGDQRAEDFAFGPHTAFTILAQLHNTFILAQTGAGLLVADQHVAHERIIYETLMAKAEDKRPAQMLVQPVYLNLTSAEEEALVRNILLLDDLGLVLERFGARQYVLRSEPAGQSMDQAMFVELLESLGEGSGAGRLDAAREALYVMSACKGAVKANTPLSAQEMQSLLLGLQRTMHPMTCPHGRPILYLLPYRRLLQAFGRA